MIEKWTSYFKEGDIKDSSKPIWAVWAFLILYCHNSWVPGFFHDGYLYAALGKVMAEGGSWLVPKIHNDWYPQYAQHPPLVFIIQSFIFKIFGTSWLVLRLSSCFFVFLTGWVLYKIFILFEQRRWGVWSLWLYLLLPPMMKKARFPNIDFPLSLCLLICFYFYLKSFKEEKSIKNWLLVGLFFGFALLIKGPVAFVVGMVIFAHLFLIKKLSYLFDYRPWLGLILGFFIFSLWPILAAYYHDYDVTKNYIIDQVVRTIFHGRGKEEATQYFEYFRFLLFRTTPWFILVILSLKKMRSLKLIRQDIFKSFWLAFAFVFLFFFSLMKVKYSNYLIPFYPAFAALGSYWIFQLNENYQHRTLKGLQALIVCAGLALLIFPLTDHVRRDRSLIKAWELSRSLPGPPKTWVNFRNAYPVANFADFLSLKGVPKFFKGIGDEVFNEKLGDAIFLVKNPDIHVFENREGFNKIIYYKKGDFWLVLKSEAKTVFLRDMK